MSATVKTCESGYRKRERWILRHMLVNLSIFNLHPPRGELESEEIRLSSLKWEWGQGRVGMYMKKKWERMMRTKATERQAYKK